MCRELCDCDRSGTSLNSGITGRGAQDAKLLCSAAGCKTSVFRRQREARAPSNIFGRQGRSCTLEGRRLQAASKLGRARSLRVDRPPIKAHRARITRVPCSRGPRPRPVITGRCASRTEGCATSAQAPVRRYLVLMNTQYDMSEPVKVPVHAEK